MRRGVEYYARLVLLEQLVQLIPIRNGGYLHAYRIIRAVIAQYLLLYLVGGVLVYIHNYYFGRTVLDYLSDKLRAYRSASAGNHTYLTLDIRGHALRAESNLLSAKQVADIDFSYLADHIRGAYQLADVRQHSDLTARLHTVLDNSLTRAARHGRNCEYYDGYGVLGSKSRYLLRRADNGHAVDDTSALFQVVVHKAYGLVNAVPARKLLYDRAAGRTRADNERTLLVLGLDVLSPAIAQECVGDMRHADNGGCGKRHDYVHVVSAHGYRLSQLKLNGGKQMKDSLVKEYK